MPPVKKRKNLNVLIAVLVGGLSILYKVNFVKPIEKPENLVLSPKIEENWTKIEQINLDLAVFQDPKFGTFTSIETKLPVVPLGRINPFAAVVGR